MFLYLIQQQHGADEDVISVWHPDDSWCSYCPPTSSPACQPEGDLWLAGELSQKPALSTVAVSHSSTKVPWKHTVSESSVSAHSALS